jgi:AcrR family transcriptional regulator
VAGASGTSAGTAAGTPTTRRDPDRRAAICAAVFELLGEVGYDRMTMDAVATRARASKATIYRTWQDKPGLVADSLIHHFDQITEPVDTGSLRGDLMALTGSSCELANSADGEVMAGVMSAAARNSALARTLRECTYEQKHALHETVIKRAVERGDVHPRTSPHLLHEVLQALVLARRLVNSEPLDEQFARHVVDDVLLPVLTHDVGGTR